MLQLDVFHPTEYSDMSLRKAVVTAICGNGKATFASVVGSLGERFAVHL